MEYHKKARVFVRFVAVAAMVLATGAGTAFAQIDIDGENDTTGASSFNENRTDIIQTLVRVFTRDADVDNDFDLDVDASDNVVSSNTTVDGFSVGGFEGDIAFETMVNETDESSTSAGTEVVNVSGDYSNSTTGASSENRNRTTVTRNSTTTHNLTADVDNDFDFDFDYGDQVVSSNTTVGDVSIGGADLTLTSETRANRGGAQVMPVAMPDVNISGGNSRTGASSFNENRTDITVNDTQVATSTADIDTDVDVDVDQSGNTFSSNTTLGDITIQPSRVNVRVVNSAN